MVTMGMAQIVGGKYTVKIFHNPWHIYMLIVAFLLSFAANYNKLVIQNSDTTFGSSVIFLLVGLLFLTRSVVKKYEIKAVYKKNLCKLLLVGLVFALAEITINMALIMQIVPYAISLRRLSILFSVFYGGLLFREKNIPQRSLAALIMLIGIIIIILSWLKNLSREFFWSTCEMSINLLRLESEETNY